MCIKFRIVLIYFNLLKEFFIVNLICNKNNFWDQNQNVNNFWRIVINNLNEFDFLDIYILKFGCGKFFFFDLLKEKKYFDIFY